MPLRVACIGGGPGGLFFATLLRRHDPTAEVVVFERNHRHDAFGFGVVFSESALKAVDAADPVLRDGLREHGHHWDRIEVRLKGERRSLEGNGMAAIHRRTLLPLLHRRAEEAGVDLRFGTEITDPSTLSDFDVVVGADGANSRVRRWVSDDLGHSTETARAKFIWFGTRHTFDGLTFVHRRSEHGTFAAHAYPIAPDLSTFIVETDEHTWRAAGLDRFDTGLPPGVSDERSRSFIEDLFSEDLDSAEVVANNSRWASFRTHRSRSWHSGNVVLLGDAVHTAHFSVGSGTKMAMEDGLVLAEELASGHGSLEEAFTAYEARRQPAVQRIQDAAAGGLSWWENFGLYHREFAPTRFAFHFFSRSINIDRIEPRDPALVARVRKGWEQEHGAAALSTPLRTTRREVPCRRFDWDGSVLRVPGQEGSVFPDEELTVLRLPGEGHGAPVDAFELAAATAGETVLVTGGDPLDRTRVGEELRLRRGRAAIIAVAPDEPLDAETLILSGRADAVAHVTHGDHDG
ncbi:FAD-dependent monooxygenase [Nocardiopsis sp. HNM0947]|uniref:FAD-dependent monooxygenase n=1 Tax=Nocardiopsis coralli TaxID=2772213 RepID=A0ABR9NZZ2_9ACTN|nr:FAD-dependent monooxygenase [Nocardiopsis coralli]MBE2997133.1 FAD-dependent monooxygenase [Nocardiopsis coralli]